MNSGQSLRAELERTRAENRALRRLILERTLVDLDLDPTSGLGLVTARQYPRDRDISVLMVKDWLIDNYGAPVVPP